MVASAVETMVCRLLALEGMEQVCHARKTAYVCEAGKEHGGHWWVLSGLLIEGRGYVVQGERGGREEGRGCI